MRPASIVAAAAVAVIAVIGCIVPAEPPARGGAFEDVRRVVALLDDIAAEYPRAVDRGAVTDATRMRVIETMLHDAQLFGSRFPEDERALLHDLANAVGSRDAPARVVELARRIRGELMINHQLVLAPSAPPDRRRADELWGMLCAGCHGVTGFGDGPQGLDLDPPPKAFQDPAFMAELAPSRAFSQISDGVRGTAMPQWGLFTTSERWGLALLVFSFRHEPDAIARGRAIVERLDTSLSLTATSDRTDRELTAELRRRGLAPREADDALAFLRSDAAFAPPAGRFAAVRATLADVPSRFVEGGAASLVARARRMLAPSLDALRAVSPTTTARIEDRLHRLEASVDAHVLYERTDREVVALAALLDRAEAELRVDIGGTIRLALELCLLASLALGLVWSRRSIRQALPTSAGAALLAAAATATATIAIGALWIGLGVALIVTLALSSRRSAANASAPIVAALIGLPIGRLARSLVETFDVAGLVPALAAALAIAGVIIATHVLARQAFARWPRASGVATTSVLVLLAASSLARGAWPLTSSTLAFARVEVLGIYPSALALAALALGLAAGLGAATLGRRRGQELFRATHASP